MYLRRLDLIAYGHFTRQSVELTPGLNIVYGDNEAGKSTTLRALRQLLYGIEHHCSDTFLYEGPKLRIGAVLADGARTLEIIRRKTRKDSLRAADDQTVIPEEGLAEFLDGVDAGSFQQRFGIDYKQLVAGGKEICEGKGELGEILFAAASGVADLRQVVGQLDEQAQSLFKPGGSKPELNQALKEMRELRQRIKDLQLPNTEWEQHDRSLHEATRQREHVLAELGTRLADKKELERIRAALPWLDQRRELLARREALQDAPDLSDDFSERRQALVVKHQKSQSEHEVFQQRHARALQSLESLVVSDRLLRQAEAIGELQEAFGAYQQAQKDRPGLVSRQLACEADILSMLREIGRDEEPDRVLARGIPRPLQSRLQKLALARERMQTERNNVEVRQRKLLRDLERCRQELSEIQTLADTANLARQLRHARSLEELEQQTVELGRDVAEQTEDWAARQAQLQLAPYSREQLERLALPPTTTLQRFEDTWSRLQNALEQNRERFQEHERELEQLQRQIEKLREEQRVPTDEELLQARQLRDSGWSVLRAMLLGQTAHSPTEAARVIPEFESALARTDEMADQMRHQSNLVARQAQWMATCDEIRHKLRQLDQQKGQLEAEWHATRAEWETLWLPLGVLVLPPREMREWAAAVVELIEGARQLRRLEHQFGEQQHRLEEARRQLAQTLQLLLPDQDGPTTLREAVRVGQEFMDLSEGTARRRGLLQEEEKKARTELGEIEAHRTQLTEDLANWQEEWSDCMRSLELSDSTAPDEAQMILEGIREALAKHQDAERYRERIAGIDRDASVFVAQVQSLLHVVADDLCSAPVELSVRTLGERLGEAQKIHARRLEVTLQLEEDRRRVEQLEQVLRGTRIELDLLCREAGCRSIDQLPEAERRASQRRDTERELRAVHDQLRHLADGVPLERFVEQAGAWDRDQLVADLARLEQELADLNARRDQLNETIGTEKTRLESMDGRGEAAEAEAELANRCARMRTDVEQYARLKLAAYVLRETIERYREKYQDPVLRRGGELFRTLTLGAFVGLRVGLGDNGHPVMEGIRPDGQFLGVKGMSDGASDQLYLALRVASLEHHFARRKSVPVIVDDILVMFDDDRAAAALSVLAELSRHCQIIFFTHHRHLLDIAQDHLDPEGYAVRHLSSC
jgi:uncharacterized protein YhaN